MIEGLAGQVIISRSADKRKPLPARDDGAAAQMISAIRYIDYLMPSVTINETFLRKP
jgi:hypothetical protein